MNPDPTTQELLATWKRSMDQAMEAWQKTIGQPAAPDVFQFWRPLFGQNVDVWTQMLRQGASSPDVLAQWKKFMDESVEAWSKALGKAMETEGFASAMGKFLDQYLNTVGPMRKSLQASNEEFLRTMNLPSRKQVTDLASQVISLEARLEPLEEQIEKLGDSMSMNLPSRKQVTDLASQVGSLEARLGALQERIGQLGESLSRIEDFVTRAQEERDPPTQKGKHSRAPKGDSHKEV